MLREAGDSVSDTRQILHIKFLILGEINMLNSVNTENYKVITFALCCVVCSNLIYSVHGFKDGAELHLVVVLPLLHSPLFVNYGQV